MIFSEKQINYTNKRKNNIIADNSRLDNNRTDNSKLDNKTNDISKLGIVKGIKIDIVINKFRISILISFYLNICTIY